MRRTAFTIPILFLGFAIGCQTPLEEIIEPAGQPVPLTPSLIKQNTHTFAEPDGDTFVVTTTADTIESDSFTSLREAVFLATADPEPNAIVFDPGVFRAGRITPIALAESLLLGGDGDVIDGASATVDGGAVVLDGGAIPGSNIAIVVLRSPGTRVRELTIGNVPGAAVLVDVGRSGAAVGVQSCRLVNCSIAGVFINDPLDAPLVVTGTTFEDIGGEPIDYPLSKRPTSPRVGEIAGNLVRGFATPNSRVEIFLDDAHLAGTYLGATTAGADGSFVLDTGLAPKGKQINVTSRSPGGVTSSLRTIGGSPELIYLAALLTGTGPVSEGSGAVDNEAPVLRWKNGTHLVIHSEETLGGVFEVAMRDFVRHIPALTNGQISAEMRVGALGSVSNGDRVVEFEYVPSSSAELAGSEGRSFLTFVNNELIQARVVVNRNSVEPGVGVHELGHVLGLRHLCVNGQTLMDTSSCSSIGVVVNIHPDGASYFDALALKALYDPAVLPGDTLGDLRALGLVP